MRFYPARFILAPSSVRQRLLRWVYGIRMAEQDAPFGPLYLDCVQPTAHVAGGAIGMIIGFAGPKVLSLLPNLDHSILVALQFGAFLLSMLLAFPHFFLLFKRLDRTHSE